MNNIVFKIKKHFVNKKANTKKLKYEALLEEVEAKNQKIIDLLYERIDLESENKEQEKLIFSQDGTIASLNEKIERLSERNAELLKENDLLRKRKNK